jgi:DNA-binding response OmpR family regulator
MKILIVEDEVVLSKVLKEKFKKEKFETRIVDNGNDVLKAAASFKPDMILLDLLLPGKHGLTVLKELKADADLNVIPVIILSNMDSDEDIKKGLKLGAVDYFVKAQHPIKEVVAKVAESLAKVK